MPLSEHEQRILADIEARLREDDPRFADVVGTTTVSAHLRRQLRLAAAGFFVGFVLIFVGLQTNLIWGVVGFAVMLGCAYFGLTTAKRLAESSRTATEAAGGRGPLQRYLDSATRREDDDAS